MNKWVPGNAPVSVVMISLNEAHNMHSVLQNLQGWAHDVLLIDSFSQDDTVNIALQYGVTVLQRKFEGFGSQWNFALEHARSSAPWTMKLDPDERLSETLKQEIIRETGGNSQRGLSFDRRLWFMDRRLPIKQKILRVWPTGQCRFSDVSVNEYPIVELPSQHLSSELEHHDSPHLQHWYHKQNNYTTAEAIAAVSNTELSFQPRLFGSSMERRMWLKKNFFKLPFRYFFLFLYNWLWVGAWRAGSVGYIWARLRSDVMRMIEYKRKEIELTGRCPDKLFYGTGQPHPDAVQAEPVKQR